MFGIQVISTCHTFSSVFFFVASISFRAKNGIKHRYCYFLFFFIFPFFFPDFFIAQEYSFLKKNNKQIWFSLSVIVSPQNYFIISFFDSIVFILFFQFFFIRTLFRRIRAFYFCCTLKGIPFNFFHQGLDFIIIQFFKSFSNDSIFIIL